MSELFSIANGIDSLRLLQDKKVIFIEDLPVKFRADLQKFIVGATLSMKDGKLVVGKNIYQEWLQKIRTKGFDYEIDFKK